MYLYEHAQKNYIVLEDKKFDEIDDEEYPPLPANSNFFQRFLFKVKKCCKPAKKYYERYVYNTWRVDCGSCAPRYLLFARFRLRR
jgi:hypothetical protein